jgi:hypothetical protein
MARLTRIDYDRKRVFSLTVAKAGGAEDMPGKRSMWAVCGRLGFVRRFDPEDRGFRDAFGLARRRGVQAMSRWRAAAIHLGISIGVFLVFLALMLRVWYPHPYFEAIGADGLLMILVGVDVVLGPLITLIIFKSGKPGLKFDLAVIGVVQFAALLYGASVVAQARPAFIVFAVDRFEVMQASDIDFNEARYPRFASAPWTGPQLAAAVLPQDLEKRQELLFSALAGGADVQNRAAYYEPYEQHAPRAASRGLPLDRLRAKGPDATARLERFLAAHAAAAADLVYLPVRARKQDLAMLLDRASGNPLGAVVVDPW